MVGRLSLGVAPTRDDLTRVGDIARTAREGLGFAHVFDLLPPHGAYAPPPSTLLGFAPFQQPPPGTQPGGFSWTSWAGPTATQPGGSTWQSSSLAPPMPPSWAPAWTTQAGGSSWQTSVPTAQFAGKFILDLVRSLFTYSYND